MRLDHLLSKEHLIAVPRGGVVYVVSVGVRLTHGKLISGALANRMTYSSLGSLVPPEPLAGDGSGKTGWGIEMGPDTLLGPEETDQVRGHRLRSSA